MRKPLGALVTAAVAVGTVGFSANASAATEIGDNCVADTKSPTTELGLFEVAVPSNPLPTAAPSAGIVTRWKIASAVAEPVVPQTMKVVRQLGPTAVQIQGEALGSVLPGTNSFETRIAIHAGDRIAVTGPTGILFCMAPGQPGTLGVFDAKGIQGQTVAAAEAGAEARIPISAVIEPDADNDGFGDETQDRCPQVASLQTSCPVTVLDSFALAKKGKAVVLVSASETTAVTVTGSARLPRVKTRKKARASAQAKLPKVTKAVEDGRITRFTLNFPARLRSALASLPKGRSVTLNLTATAPNASGELSTDKAKLKLKG